MSDGGGHRRASLDGASRTRAPILLPSDDVAGAGTTCAVVDLTAPSSAARAGVLARGAAAAAQGLVAPALAAAAARAARAAAAREREEKDEKEKEEEKDETAARELGRLRAARDAARAKAARDGAVRVLAEKAKRARDAVAAAVRTGAAALARASPRFAPALRRHRPARGDDARGDGGWISRAGGVRGGVTASRRGTRAREVTRAGILPGDDGAAAAAAAVDAAETMCHRLRRLAASAERAEAEYYAAEAEAARADDKANEEMVAAEETMKARRDAAEDSEMKAAEGRRRKATMEISRMPSLRDAPRRRADDANARSSFGSSFDASERARASSGGRRLIGVASRRSERG